VPKIALPAIVRVPEPDQGTLMINLSQHARKRCRQRGIPHQRLATIIDLADIDVPIGSNCRMLRVSRHLARTIRGGDRLKDVAVIYSDTNAQVVTVLHTVNSERGRRYRMVA
jgi:hypothetical protein